MTPYPTIPIAFTSIMFLVSLSACDRLIVVNPSDTSSPTIRVHITPGAMYADDNSPVSGAVNPDRRINIPARGATDFVHFNAVATDEESAINHVTLTLSANFTCGANTPSNLITWAARANWSKSNGSPDEPGSTTSKTTNVLVLTSAHKFWTEGRCQHGPSTNPFVPPRSNGFLRTNVVGTYTARACNNANAPRGTPLCTTQRGEFVFRTGRMAVP